MTTLLIAAVLLVWFVVAVAGIGLCRAAARGDADEADTARLPAAPDLGHRLPARDQAPARRRHDRRD